MGWAKFSEDIIKRIDELNTDYSNADSFLSKNAIFQQIKNILPQLKSEIQTALEYVTSPEMPNRDLVMENQSLEAEKSRLEEDLKSLREDYNKLSIKYNAMDVELRKAKNRMTELSMKKEFSDQMEVSKMEKHSAFREKQKSMPFNTIKF